MFITVLFLLFTLLLVKDWGREAIK